MRRSAQALREDENIDILMRNTAGVLAVSGDDEYPYAVPLSYVYEDGKIYFHSAKAGHKIDAIRRSDKASFTVIDRDEVVPDEYTSYYRSIIAFGRIRLIEDSEEAMDRIIRLSLKYHPTDTTEHRDDMIRKYWKSLQMIEFTIEHLTGKEAIELRRKTAEE